MQKTHGMQEIGAFLRAKRANASLTQAELAKKLHVTRQAVSKWEQGHSEPDVDTFLRLAEALGFTMDELLGTADTVRTETAPKEAPGAAAGTASALPSDAALSSGTPWYAVPHPKAPPLPPVLSARETSAGAGLLMPLGIAALLCLCASALGGGRRGKRRRTRFRVRPYGAAACPVDGFLPPAGRAIRLGGRPSPPRLRLSAVRPADRRISLRPDAEPVPLLHIFFGLLWLSKLLAVGERQKSSASVRAYRLV